jgi:hypothetical protein
LGWEVWYLLIDCDVIFTKHIWLTTFILQGRKDLVHCWCILLRQKVDESYCCVQYLENHVDLLDFLVVWYDLLLSYRFSLNLLIDFLATVWKLSICFL